jgi:hypothetical protein
VAVDLDAHPQALALEVAADEVGDRGLVLDDEHQWRGGHGVMVPHAPDAGPQGQRRISSE